jgi:hypothetical protein
MRAPENSIFKKNQSAVSCIEFYVFNTLRLHSTFMTMLERVGNYEPQKTQQALEMLLVDRKNEFREIAETIMQKMPTSTHSIKNWEEFVLYFCLDVSRSFSSWSGDAPLEPNAGAKALTILRQVGRAKKSMINLTRELNLAYDIAEEFKAIYKRLS